jgi:hypothetical protein
VIMFTIKEKEAQIDAERSVALAKARHRRAKNPNTKNDDNDDDDDDVSSSFNSSPLSSDVSYITRATDPSVDAEIEAFKRRSYRQNLKKFRKKTGYVQDDDNDEFYDTIDEGDEATRASAKRYAAKNIKKRRNTKKRRSAKKRRATTTTKRIVAGKARTIHTGKRGGKYFMRASRRVYVN